MAAWLRRSAGAEIAAQCMRDCSSMNMAWTRTMAASSTRSAQTISIQSMNTEYVLNCYIRLLYSSHSSPSCRHQPTRSAV